VGLAGRPVHAPQLVVYRTRERFVADMRAVGFSDSFLAMFERSSAPRPLLVAAWTAWMPPDAEPSAVCELLAQGFFDVLSGDASRRVRWLDAGFARWVAKRECPASSEARDARGVDASAAITVERIVTRFGEKKLVELIAALHDEELEPAMRKVLGVDLAGVQLDAGEAPGLFRVGP